VWMAMLDSALSASKRTPLAHCPLCLIGGCRHWSLRWIGRSPRPEARLWTCARRRCGWGWAAA
jgi:hypothetical protein